MIKPYLHHDIIPNFTCEYVVNDGDDRLQPKSLKDGAATASQGNLKQHKETGLEILGPWTLNPELFSLLARCMAPINKFT